MSVCSATVCCCDYASELPSLKARKYKFSCPVYQKHTVSCIFTPRLKKQFQTPWESEPCFGGREVEEAPPLAFSNKTKSTPVSRAQPCAATNPMHTLPEHTAPHARLRASAPTLRKRFSNFSGKPEQYRLAKML